MRKTITIETYNSVFVCSHCHGVSLTDPPISVVAVFSVFNFISCYITFGQGPTRLLFLSNIM